MIRTVAPHDLVAICAECGITLAILSDETGISENELLSFAEGRVGLDARDRQSIIMTLADHLAGGSTHKPSPWALKASIDLRREVEAQEREEDEDLMTF